MYQDALVEVGRAYICWGAAQNSIGVGKGRDLRRQVARLTSTRRTLNNLKVFRRFTYENRVLYDWVQPDTLHCGKMTIKWNGACKEARL